MSRRKEEGLCSYADEWRTCMIHGYSCKTPYGYYNYLDCDAYKSRRAELEENGRLGKIAFLAILAVLVAGALAAAYWLIQVMP